MLSATYDAAKSQAEVTVSQAEGTEVSHNVDSAEPSISEMAKSGKSE